MLWGSLKGLTMKITLELAPDVEAQLHESAARHVPVRYGAAAIAKPDSSPEFRRELILQLAEIALFIGLEEPAKVQDADVRG